MSGPLRILHVANLTLSPRGSGFFGTAYKLSNGLVRCGHHVLGYSDREQARTSGLIRNRKWGAPASNRKLLEIVREFQPDLVLLGHADTIRPETVQRMREVRPGLKLAQWNIDPLFDSGNIARLNSKIGLVDATFVTTSGPQLAELGGGRHRVAFLPNPLDPSIERGRSFELPAASLSFDLVLPAGSATLPRFHAGKETTPEALAAAIGTRLPQLRTSFPGIGGEPHTMGDAYEKLLLSAAMGLSLSRRNDVYLYASDRFAHMAGNGLLVFLDRAAGYGEFFGEEELGFYATEKELFEKLARFLADDAARRRVAEAGWRAYRALFDVTRICRYMVGVIFEEIDPAAHVWRRA